MLDSDGRVVGVNSAFLSEGQSLNFAVLVGSVKELLAGLDDSGKSDTVELADLESALAGKATGPVSGAEVVRAQRFELVNAEGEVLAVLGLGAAGRPGLTLWDEKGEGRAALSLGPGGRPAIMLYDEKGELRAVLGLVRDGGPAIELFDEKGETRATLALLADGTPALSLSDEKGEVIWGAP